MTIFLSALFSSIISLNGLFLSMEKPPSYPSIIGSIEQTVVVQPKNEVIASKSLSLENRHATSSINEIFKKNILLNVAYIGGSVIDKNDINWDQITSEVSASFVLKPGETFAYHDHVYPKYEQSLTVAPKTYFNASDGYLFSGFLYGDGVCHLASIINWTAEDAGLEVEVPKLHSIAPIPDIPDEYGVSIYTIEGQKNSGTGNNLYITNNQESDIEFRISYKKGQDLQVEVIKLHNLDLSIS